MDFYGTSEFWYSMRDVLGMGGDYSPAEYESRSTEFCSTEWRYVRSRYTKHLYTYANLYRLRYTVVVYVCVCVCVCSNICELTTCVWSV